MTQTARRLQAERLQGPAALREAQALRYRVFSAEFDAKLNGAPIGTASIDPITVGVSYVHRF